MSERTAERNTAEVKEHIEKFRSLGHPHCDVCYNLSKEDRPDEAEFWPEEPTVFIRGDKRRAVDFFAIKLCDHHDTPDNHPEDATHRVIDTPEWVDDEHEMKHIVDEIREV
jgi:hypothetical protein